MSTELTQMDLERVRDENRHTRRRYLQLGSVATLGATVPTGGCLDVLSDETESIEYGTVDLPSPATDESAFTKWTPARSAFDSPPETEDQLEFPLLYAEPATLATSSFGAGFDSYLGNFQGILDYFGPAFRAFERFIAVVWTHFVLEAQFDPGTVGELLLDSGYERAGTYRGYALFERRDLPRTVCLSESWLVFGTRADLQTLHDRTRTIVDAGTGHADRFVDTYDGATLGDRIGSYPFTEQTKGANTLLEFGSFVTRTPAGTDVPDDRRRADDDALVGSANGCTFDENAAYFVVVQEYESGKTPSKAEIQNALDRRGNVTGSRVDETVRQASAVDIDVSPPIVTVQLRVDQEAYVELEDGVTPVPRITWGIDHDRERNSLTIRHEAGDSVAAENLSFELFRNRADYTPDETTVLGAGDELTIDLEPGGDSLFFQLSYDGPTNQGFMFSYSFESES